MSRRYLSWSLLLLASLSTVPGQGYAQEPEAPKVPETVAEVDSSTVVQNTVTATKAEMVVPKAKEPEKGFLDFFSFEDLLRRSQAEPDASGSRPRPTNSTNTSTVFLGEVGPPLPYPDSLNAPAERPRLSQTLLHILLVFVAALLIWRLAGWGLLFLVRKQPRYRAVLPRLWGLLEGTFWLCFGFWATRIVVATESIVAVVAAGVVVLVLLLLGINALRDISAGLLLVIERPYDLGDYVSIGGTEGVVQAFRTRSLELVNDAGRQVILPYRTISGAVEVIRGGHRLAHRVRLNLPIEAFSETQEALKRAMELVTTSPWAQLDGKPRLELVTDAEGRAILQVEAYAFCKEAQPKLSADVLSAWKNQRS